MGLTTIPVTVSNIRDKKEVSLDFLVDTGATYTVIPAKVVKQLGLTVDRMQRFSLADGSVMERGLGFAMVEVDGIKAPSTVVIGRSGDSPLLGALTLEGMGLMVDPFNRRLIPMKLMLA